METRGRTQYRNEDINERSSWDGNGDKDGNGDGDEDGIGEGRGEAKHHKRTDISRSRHVGNGGDSGGKRKKRRHKRVGFQ